MKTTAEIITGKFGNYQGYLSQENWQNFTKTVIQERGAVCENCRQGGMKLHVHHLSYNPNVDPFQMPRENFVVLCPGCHSQLHAELVKFRRYVFRYLRPETFKVLNGALAVGLTHHDPLEFLHAVAEMATSPGSVKRFAYAWCANDKPTRATETEVFGEKV